MKKILFIFSVLFLFQGNLFSQAKEILSEQIIGDWLISLRPTQKQSDNSFKLYSKVPKDMNRDLILDKISFSSDSAFVIYYSRHCTVLPYCGTHCVDGFEPEKGTWSIEGSNRYYTLTLNRTNGKLKYEIVHFSEDELILKPTIKELVDSEN